MADNDPTGIEVTRPHGQTMRKLAGNAVLVVAGLVVGVLLAEAAGRFLIPAWRDFYSGRFMRIVHVPGHGIVTTGRPGFDGYFAQNNGDFRVRVRINAIGLRNPEPVDKADGRVWVVGDSVTFGWGVEQDQMYSSVITRATGWATYNIASPGTDVCGYQALIARMPAAIRPKAVIVGLTIENDIRQYDCRGEATRVVSPASAAGDEVGDEISWGTVSFTSLKRFLTRHSALYNVAVVALKRAAFLNEAMVRFGLAAHEHVDRGIPATERTESVAADTAAEIARLRDMVRKGTLVAVLLIPARFDIRDASPAYVRRREALTDALRRLDVPVIDPTAAFRAAGFATTHFPHDGHWSPLGHRLAGEFAADWLRRRGIGG